MNEYMRKRPEIKAGEVTIRVLSSSDKCVEVKPGMKNRYVETGEWPEQFPYRAKALFAWEEIDGVDVCFFGMHVQEYGSDSSPPNRRRVYLAYLDSVHFFRPKQVRTAVYHEILLGYLDYAKQLGYSMAHIWACPPSEGDDYIFHCHPPEQKIPKPKRLQDWYKKMLDKGLHEKIVVDYKDILKQATEDNFKSPAELPYFEGDFWPNVIEKSLKELEIEKYAQPNSNPAITQGNENDEDKAENTEGDETGPGGVKAEKEYPPQEENGSNKKKQNANKKSSKKQSQRKNNVNSSRNKGGASNNHSQAITNPARAWEAELTNKIYQTMEKHREVFFVIRLHSLADAAKLKPIQDPDGQISCDLMDGRDAFLTMAREKHYEFSSLRRAKFSSMCMLYELHNSSNDRFVYTCNVCKNHLVESRFHCTVCEDYDLCKNCYLTENHLHKMEKLEFGELGSAGSGDDSGFGGSISGLAGSAAINDGGSSSAMSNALSPGDSRKQSIQRCMQGLVHACNCRDANCRMPACIKMKRVVFHSRGCKKRQSAGKSTCPVCRQLIALCCYHSKVCEDTQNKCTVPFCAGIKNRLKQQQVQARMRQHQLMQSRIRSMTNAVNASAIAAESTPTMVASASPVASIAASTKPKPILPNSQHASLNAAAAANNMSPGPNMTMTPTGITSSGAGMGKPGSAPMNHVHPNNCYDSPSPIQPPTPNESMQYIKPHVTNTNVPQRAPVMQQQQITPPQRMIRHPMVNQGPQVQQGGQPIVTARPPMMQQTMPGQRMMGYAMGPQAPQMAPQSQQIAQQQPQQQVQQQQQQVQQSQQQLQPMSWQSFPSQQNNMMHSNMRPMTNAVNVSSASPAPTIVASVSPAAGMAQQAKPKPIIPNSQHASLNAAANNMSPGPNMTMTPTGITTSGAGMGKPGSASMNHVHVNNCCDSPSPLQAPAPNESVQYIKQHGVNTGVAQRPQMIQTMAPQRMIRHQMANQRPQIQPGVQGNIARPTMIQQTMPGQRMMSYSMGPQGQQVITQQVPQQQQQHQHPQQQQQQHQQHQHQQMGWQGFSNQQTMMQTNMNQQGFMPHQQQQQQQQQMNQMGNPQQHMMRGGMPMGNMRAPSMIRPVGVSRVAAVRYNNMNMGHVVNDQDMLAYPNQGSFINRNQQNQQELTPQEKLSHYVDKL